MPSKISKVCADLVWRQAVLGVLPFFPSFCSFVFFFLSSWGFVRLTSSPV
jgi:hypothetical protein